MSRAVSWRWPISCRNQAAEGENFVRTRRSSSRPLHVRAGSRHGSKSPSERRCCGSRDRESDFAAMLRSPSRYARPGGRQAVVCAAAAKVKCRRWVGKARSLSQSGQSPPDTRRINHKSAACRRRILLSSTRIGWFQVPSEISLPRVA